MEIKIQSGVPISNRKGGAGRPSKYPFSQMLIGQSFWVSESRRSVGSAALIHGKTYNRKFITRAETINGVKGIRVWRVE